MALTPMDPPRTFSRGYCSSVPSRPCWIKVECPQSTRLPMRAGEVGGAGITAGPDPGPAWKSRALVFGSAARLDVKTEPAVPPPRRCSRNLPRNIPPLRDGSPFRRADQDNARVPVLASMKQIRVSIGWFKQDLSYLGTAEPRRADRPATGLGDGRARGRFRFSPGVPRRRASRRDNRSEKYGPMRLRVCPLWSNVCSLCESAGRGRVIVGCLSA
jgi:hypothetical protein